MKDTFHSLAADRISSSIGLVLFIEGLCQRTSY